METIIGPWQISIQRAWPANSQLAAWYDAAASDWHKRIARLGYLRAYAGLIKIIDSMGYLTHLTHHSPVLDCGIGTAGFSLTLAQHLSSPIQIHGIDISEAMARKAETILTEAGVTADIRSGSVCDLPYPDHSFDVVLSAHMLEHCPNPAAALREMVNVLQTGGTLVLVVTRPGLWGTYLQWQWGNDTFGATTLKRLLDESGLTDIVEIPLNGGLSRFTSRAFVGVKS